MPEDLDPNTDLDIIYDGTCLHCKASQSLVTHFVQAADGLVYLAEVWRCAQCNTREGNLIGVRHKDIPPISQSTILVPHDD